MNSSSKATVESKVDDEAPAEGTEGQKQDRIIGHFTEESEFWKDIYQQRDVFAAIHRLRRRLVLSWIDHLHVPPGSHVLEVGCGAGLLTVDLAKRGYAVTATDAVAAMVEETRGAVSRAGCTDRVKTFRSDAHGLALRDDGFLLVVALGVIPWLHSPGKALREMARVLEPGGCLIANSDNLWRLNHVLDPRRFPLLTPLRRKVREALERGGLLITSSSGHLSRAHTLREFDAMLADAKLERERQVTFGFGPFTFLNYPAVPEVTGIKLHRRLQQLADRNVPFIRSSGCQYLVLARKS